MIGQMIRIDHPTPLIIIQRGGVITAAHFECNAERAVLRRDTIQIERLRWSGRPGRAFPTIRLDGDISTAGVWQLLDWLAVRIGHRFASAHCTPDMHKIFDLDREPELARAIAADERARDRAFLTDIAEMAERLG